MGASGTRKRLREIAPVGSPQTADKRLRCGRYIRNVLGLEPWRDRSGCNLDDAVAHGIEDKLTNRMEPELPHDIAAVSLSRLHAQVKMARHFLGRLPLSQKLHHLALP